MRDARPLAFARMRNPCEEFLALAARLERERHDAATRVPRILQETARDDWPCLLAHRELRNSGALEQLSAIVTAQLPRDPQYAVAVARLAVSIAEDLPYRSYPRVTLTQLRCHAWNDLGKTLSFLGRYDEAVELLTRAAEEADERLVLTHDRAIIRFNLAITYQEMQRYTESLKILEECKEVFRGFRDTRLLMVTGLAEGVLLQRLGKFREARETYLLLLASTRDLGKENLAALHRAIGLCSMELGDFDDAEDNLANAVLLHRDIGQSVEVVKDDLAIGRVLIRRGLYREGIAHLRPVRRQFLRFSLAEEAGLCGLSIVEAMLVDGDAEGAEILARTIMSEFLAASLSARAVTALGYLSEAIATNKATARMATQVHEYVLSLRSFPEREFSPAQLFMGEGS